MVTPVNPPVTTDVSRTFSSFNSKLLAVALVLCSTLVIMWLASIRNGLLFIIGAGLGIALLIGGIGFAGPWRNFIVHREPRGLVTTLILMALACIVFLPALANWDGVIGNIAPVSGSVIVGAFLFGIGMQLGGGCGSGTLVGAGNGSKHSLIVLLFFLPGSLIGSLHLPRWLTIPHLGQISLTELLGVPIAICVQLLIFAAICFFTVRSARTNGNQSAWLPTLRQLTGCVAIVILALASLYISGRMWSITFAQTLWSAKLANLAGLDVASTIYWSSPFPANALANTVLADVTSVMNFGLLAGVAALTLWQTRDKTTVDPYSWRQFCAAALAGLLMGYGARLAFGCNIGALFSGTASGSIHGWLWFVAAWLGSHVGIRYRPRFGLVN